MTMRDKFHDSLSKLTFIKLGLQIKINRKHRGFTVPRLAKRVKIGTTRLRAIERGDLSHVKLSTLTLLARAFDCGLSYNFINISDQIKEVNKEPEIVSTFEEDKNNVSFI